MVVLSTASGRPFSERASVPSSSLPRVQHSAQVPDTLGWGALRVCLSSHISNLVYVIISRSPSLTGYCNSQGRSTQPTPMDLGTARHHGSCGLKGQPDLKLVSRLQRPGVGSWSHSPTGDLGASLTPLNFTRQGVRNCACRLPR